MEIPTDLSIAETLTNVQQRWNLVQEYERKFEHLSEDQKLSKLCSDAGLKLVERGRCNIFADNTQCLVTRRRLVQEDGFLRTQESDQSWTKVCHHEDQYINEVLVKYLFQDRTASWVRIVNGVDKNVTESMLTKEKEDIASGKPLLKQDQGKSQQWRSLPSPFLFVKEGGQTLTHNDQTIKSVLTCPKPSPDCRDMIKHSIEIVTEHSSTMT